MLGVFVIFALGADDVFVAVDKWKNARLQNPNATVQKIATIALPDAASAMLLTTLTTSAAFFGTAVCPVAPIRCFAVFVGLMILFDYFLCVLLVFPALVIYDNRRGKGNCCCETTCRRKRDDESTIEEDTEQAQGLEVEPSLIHRILTKYYRLLHKVRWPLLAICGAAFIYTAVKAASLDLPTSSDVRLYDENDNQFEQNFVWRKNLLYDVLQKKGGSEAYVVWGITPTDNGELNNPEVWSSLVLDDSFAPSDPEAQVFLRDFCDGFFSNDFAGNVTSDYACPMNRFDDWLQVQSVSDAPDSTYQANCGTASSVPVPTADFDACMSAWAAQEEENTVLSRQGKVEVMYIKFSSRVRYDSSYDDLDKEWKIIEDYMDSLDAPAGARGG